MKAKFLSLAALLMASSLFAQSNPQPATAAVAPALVGPKPLLVLIDQNPWRMVIGSDSPTFVLYDDGTIIGVRDKPSAESESPYFTRKVSDAKQFAASLLAFNPANVEAYYKLTTWSDRGTTVIWTPEKKIQIYGSWQPPKPRSGPISARMEKMEAQEKALREALPSEICATLTRIIEERALPAVPWSPATVEIMLWPYEYAPDASIEWPKDLPDLNAPSTGKRGEKSFSVYLPADKFLELRRFLSTRKEKGAVLINGRKMAASLRFPFPGESAWMK